MDIAISGSRRLFVEQNRHLIKGILLLLPPATRLVTGACLGVDAFCATFWHTELGRAVHTVVPSDRSNVARDWRDHCDTSEELPLSSEPYRARNERLIALGAMLLAFPLHPEQDRRAERSGTWMTVRMARAAAKPAHVYRLWE